MGTSSTRSLAPYAPVHFDPVTLDVLGDPVPVVDHVMTMANGAAEFSLSREGALAYVVGGPFEILRSLVWVDRHGQEEPIKAPPRAYYLPRLSPDGTRLALDTRDQESDIWIWEFARQTLRRLTMDPALDWYPVWTPDGGRVMFSSSRAGAQNLFSQAADNTGTAERLTTSPNFQFPTSISPDGTRLIFYENSPKTGPDLRVLRMDGAKQIEPLVETTFTEHNGEISPDGHWLAYESNESGQFQIHVRPFPHVESATFQISTGGGTKPVWARSGRELFYFDGSNSMTVVPVQTTPTFTYGNPTRLFDGRYFSGPPGRTYDVSPDGTRFLMIKDGDTANPNVTPASMVIVLNWSEELKRLVPTR